MAALREALAAPGDHRLFKSGKLAGLFPRTELGVTAAERAVDDGLLAHARTEIKGKVEVLWVRLAPAGVEFLHAHESPRAVLQELRDSLRSTRAGVPVWLEAMRAEVAALNERIGTETDKLVGRLDALSQRVEAALRRAESLGPPAPPGAAAAVPWAEDALAYLDRRQQTGSADCPLAELFAAVKSRHPALSVVAYQDGLRRLADFKALRLVPFAGPPATMPEPEHALPDGAAVYYYAAR